MRAKGMGPGHDQILPRRADLPARPQARRDAFLARQLFHQTLEGVAAVLEGLELVPRGAGGRKKNDRPFHSDRRAGRGPTRLAGSQGSGDRNHATAQDACEIFRRLADQKGPFNAREVVRLAVDAASSLAWPPAIQ